MVNSLSAIFYWNLLLQLSNQLSDFRSAEEILMISERCLFNLFSLFNAHKQGGSDCAFQISTPVRPRQFQHY